MRDKVSLVGRQYRTEIAEIVKLADRRRRIESVERGQQRLLLGQAQAAPQVELIEKLGGRAKASRP